MLEEIFPLVLSTFECKKGHDLITEKKEKKIEYFFEEITDLSLCLMIICNGVFDTSFMKHVFETDFSSKSLHLAFQKK